MNQSVCTQEKVDLKLEEEASGDILSALQDRSQSIWSATNCCWCSGLTTVADKVKTLRVRTFIVRTGVWGGKSGHEQIAPGKTSSRLQIFLGNKTDFWTEMCLHLVRRGTSRKRGKSAVLYHKIPCNYNILQYHTITIPNNTIQYHLICKVSGDTNGGAPPMISHGHFSTSVPV